VWSYTNVVDPNRAARLVAWESFDGILASLVSIASINTFIWEAGLDQRLRGHHRACYLLKVLPDVYDGFFNSPVGYRAQYARSEEEGCAANRAVLDALIPKLSAHPHGIDRDLIDRSHRGAGAKIWIHEAEVEDQMGSEVSEIDYPEWASASSNGAGLLAPVGTLLEIKGAWLTPDGMVHVDPQKVDRSRDIHMEGFS
jgi:hypothetical protein